MHVCVCVCVCVLCECMCMHVRVGTSMVQMGMSYDAYDFLDKCFVRDHSQRPNAARLLKHPFVDNQIQVSFYCLCMCRAGRQASRQAGRQAGG